MGGKVINRSAEKRQAEAKAMHAPIVEQVQYLAGSSQWRAFLEFSRSFHNYSLNNLLLILSQSPDATMVAGFATSPLSVFDIAQRDPIQGAEPAPEDPARQLIGNDDHGVIAPSRPTSRRTDGASTARLCSSANGYTNPESRKVTLAENLAVEQARRRSSTRPRTSSCAISTTSTSTEPTNDGWRSKRNLSLSSSPA
ncbi:hypothetical protein ACF1AJ_17610 [Leifsonia sp. NPDC014704]|uniref:hypothetical protein n=1 Tax=Leifsonia sp. NPDC014704 TaxID=3364123 RepID=UPI0036F49BDD